MSPTLNEDALEQLTLAWLRGLGCAVRHGSGFIPGEPGSERQAFVYGP